MSGHNKWAQIKHQKGTTDKKRGALFSKILKAISAAAKTDPDPENNPRLRTLVETAKENLIPKENIEKAIFKAAEQKDLKEVIIEAYGPEKSAIIIECLTDNSNRTIAEIRNILNENGGKMGEIGSARWAFQNPSTGVWVASFPQNISDEGREKLTKLTEALEDHDDVQKIHTNAS